MHPHQHGRACALLQFNRPAGPGCHCSSRLGMAAHTKTAPKARKRATGPAKAQESAAVTVTEEEPTEKPPVFRMSGATGLTITEDKAQAIAAAHSAGVPVTRICKELGVGYHTVAALIRNRPELLASARDITANNWRTLAALGTAELVDRLPEMKDQALSVLSAIATEKAELLSGGATSRVEVIAAPAVDEWSDVVDGVVVESAPVPTGNAGQTRAAKGPPAPAPALPDHAGGEQPRVSAPRYSDAVDVVPEFEPVATSFLPPPPPTGIGGAGVRPSSRTSYPDSSNDDKIFSKST
jgi:transposase-like protein